MTATKKLTSFSVCLQCVFACTIGSGWTVWGNGIGRLLRRIADD